MRFRRHVFTSKRGCQSLNIPKAVTQNWKITTECEIDFDELSGSVTIRPVEREEVLR